MNNTVRSLKYALREAKARETQHHVERAKLLARVARLEALVDHAARWETLGRDYLIRPTNIRLAFILGTWWADRPWRTK